MYIAKAIFLELEEFFDLNAESDNHLGLPVFDLLLPNEKIKTGTEVKESKRNSE